MLQFKQEHERPYGAVFSILVPKEGAGEKKDKIMNCIRIINAHSSKPHQDSV